ncbi:MAG: hypothetical protein U5K28_11670 [Halobacteriales archaeon]|nr:hypothetical protein [Halobacteriales archaeon]
MPRADDLARLPRIECRFGLTAYPAHALGDVVRNGNLLAGPRRHFPAGILDRRYLYFLVVLVDVGDAPHLSALDEHLSRRGEVDDEPLRERPDRPSRGHIHHTEVLFVGNHREILIEVLPRPAGFLQPVVALLQPENVVVGEFPDDLLERLLFELSVRVRPADNLETAARRNLTEPHQNAGDLVRHRIETSVVDGGGFDLALLGLVGRWPAPRSVSSGWVVTTVPARDQVAAVARSAHTLEQAAHLPRDCCTGRRGRRGPRRCPVPSRRYTAARRGRRP